MKLYKNRHIVKAALTPLNDTSAEYKNIVEENFDENTSNILRAGFEDGYLKCLKDLHINYEEAFIKK